MGSPITKSQNNITYYFEMSILNKTPKQIETHIQDNLTIRDKEKDRFGEVFTSPELIDEIFNNIPLSVWKNPNTKWLDPAAGNGNFGAMIYKKLLTTLSSKIPSLEKRKTHILDNMLFMIELNKNNSDKLKTLFGSKANISTSNFLTQQEKWKRDLKTDTFDVIVGNPPFQTPKKGKYSGSVGNRTLWDKFLDTIFHETLLLKKGYLGIITPANWRRPEHHLYKTITRDNTLKYLHVYNKKSGLEKLGAQTRFDLYIVQEGEPKNGENTEIIDEMKKSHKLDVQKWPFLPNYSFDKIKKIMVPKKRGIKVIFDAGKYDARHLSKTKTKKNRHPIVHNITLRGLGLRYAKNKDKKHFKVPKVLLNFNERQYPHNDFEGKYGMSQLTFGIPIKSKTHGDKIIKAIKTEAFEEILESTKWSSFQTDYRMFAYFDPDFYKTI